MWSTAPKTLPMTECIWSGLSSFLDLEPHRTHSQSHLKAIPPAPVDSCFEVLNNKTLGMSSSIALPYLRLWYLQMTLVRITPAMSPAKSEQVTVNVSSWSKTALNTIKNRLCFKLQSFSLVYILPVWVLFFPD